jgi:hypothetical protein
MDKDRQVLCKALVNEASISIGQILARVTGCGFNR